MHTLLLRLFLGVIIISDEVNKVAVYAVDIDNSWIYDQRLLIL